MKYIKDEDPFLAVTGEPIEVEGEKAGLASVLKLCLSNFVPQQEQQLTVDDWRSVNKAIDVLEAPTNDGCFGFEDTDFDVLKKVMGWTAPIFLRRNAPKIVDTLAGATGEHPE
jgi:hypothetical protein